MVYSYTVVVLVRHFDEPCKVGVVRGIHVMTGRPTPVVAGRAGGLCTPLLDIVFLDCNVWFSFYQGNAKLSIVFLTMGVEDMVCTPAQSSCCTLFTNSRPCFNVPTSLLLYRPPILGLLEASSLYPVFPISQIPTLPVVPALNLAIYVIKKTEQPIKRGRPSLAAVANFVLLSLSSRVCSPYVPTRLASR